MCKGKFITLEGAEGVGKSTQAQSLCAWLQAQGIEVIYTREPGGTPCAERLRALLLSQHEGEDWLPLSELLLMFSARHQHLEHKIIPALKQGTWVVCDRFTDATYAYQGGGRGLDQAVIKQLETWVHAHQQPDLTLWLDLAPEIAHQRLQTRGTSDRFERQDQTFFARVRAIYAQRAEMFPERIHRIAAQGTQAEVAARIQACLRPYLLDEEAI
ncbi:dTMP kinase [Allopseudospirillum japonicum]|uniref:Thymidylate kinase n=1 Tax=Allopseudospirillum japonicum TaxID=64971 RepID=A0A1H6QDI8_9GAMM|nr:dTMP kinase [Allopseudospirillum japonicum]SEI38974.1 dTMP kinase [Allopseudospirillum japonicum]